MSQSSMNPSLVEARSRFTASSIRWGFMWALWAAVLWGAWYVPGSAVWFEAPYVDLSYDTNAEFLLAAAVLTTFNAIAVLFFLFIWNGVLGKLGEYVRTIRQMRHISKWFFIGAIFGGPMAIFGSYLAIGYIGGAFAAIAALMYPIIGATLARYWYHEKITQRAAVGIFIILAGGVTVYAPGIIAEINGTGDAGWLGYLGGAMAAIGWGVEGAIAGRGLDVADPDVGITVRFSAEVLYWVLLILPAIYFFTDQPVVELVSATFNGAAIGWLTLAGVTFAFCYVSWYKSFPLIGVGRGQAIAALYGLFAVIFLAAFTLKFPDWNFLAGLALFVFGGFVMFTESDEVLEVVRAVSTDTKTATAVNL
jgi:drug/metabolite transporter (DMT)-like permease